MKSLASIMAALGVLAVFSASPAPAEAGYRYSYSHSRLHSNLQHNSFHRQLTHRSAHRYPMSFRSHSRLHDNLDHDAFHDRLYHRSAHRSYQPSFGFSFGGYRGGSSFGYHRTGYDRWFSVRLRHH